MVDMAKIHKASELEHSLVNVKPLTELFGCSGEM